MQPATIQLLTALNKLVQALILLEIARSTLGHMIASIFNLKFCLFVLLDVAIATRHDRAGVAACTSPRAHRILHRESRASAHSVVWWIVLALAIVTDLLLMAHH